MLDSAAAGRHLARRIVLLQAIVTGAVAAAFLVAGGRAALGAACGGFAVALGGALMAWRTLGGGVAGAGTALLRLAGGLAMKWAAIVLVLYLALAKWALDPLAVLSGVIAALAVNLLAIRLRH